MMEWPLIFVSGLLGSSHCVGMCGGFAIMLGMRSESRWRNLTTQGIYTLGRIFTYSALGAIAGYGGTRLADRWGEWVNVPALLCVVAGAFLIVQGLLAAGVRMPFGRKKAIRSSPCLLASGFRTMLNSRGCRGVFIAGLLTGLLPCGLLYAFLSLAASTGDVVQGMSLMIAFGLGTAPLMIATGWGGSQMSLVVRKRLLTVAAWCVVATGCLTLYRGSNFINWGNSDAASTCPFCDPSTSSAQENR
jgi:sulfite exporter TauE/SafE